MERRGEWGFVGGTGGNREMMLEDGEEDSVAAFKEKKDSQ
jgi:hypothetical protein